MSKTAAKRTARATHGRVRRLSDRERVKPMAEQIAQNRSLPVAEARAQFADLLNQVAYRKDRVVLTRHGKGIVALIPAEDLDDLEAIEDRLDAEILENAEREADNKALVPWKAVKRGARNRR